MNYLSKMAVRAARRSTASPGVLGGLLVVAACLACLGGAVAVAGAPEAGKMAGAAAAGQGKRVAADAVASVSRINGSVADAGALARLSGNADVSAPVNDTRFQYANSLDTDKEGILYVADSGNDRVLKMTPDGRILAVWGGFGTGDGKFETPMDVAVDKANCEVYVADTMNHRIQKFSCTGKFLAKWGKKGSGKDDLNSPHGVFFSDKGELLVADTVNHRVKLISRAGATVAVWGKLGGNAGELNFPHDLIEDKNGRIFVTDFLNHRVQVFERSGKAVRSFGSFGREAGQFEHPWGIVLDNENRLWVADMSNHRLQVFSTEGAPVGQLGKYVKLFGGARADTKRPAIDRGVELGFDHPKGLAFDVQRQHVFVAHPGAHAVDDLTLR